MRIRRVVISGLAAAALAGCGGPGQEDAPSAPPLVSVSTPSATPTPTDTPAETPSGPAKVADTLCVRMDQNLVQSTLAVPTVQIRPQALPADFGLPTYDVCQLYLGTGPNGPALQVGVSVLPATKATLAAAVKGTSAKPVAVGDGGFATSSYVVFLLDGRLYKISGPPATPAKYVVLAQEVARQAPGLPEAQPLITRSECERGSSAAENIMGAPAMVRRDGETPVGDLVCGWVNANGALYTSVRRTPNADLFMQPLRNSPTSLPIPLGDEAYVNTATGRTTIRVGENKLVDLVPLPPRPVKPDLMTKLALAMSPLYTR